MAAKGTTGVKGTKGTMGVFRPGQSTLQSNPLDAVVPFGASPAQEAQEQARKPDPRAEQRKERPHPGPGTNKERFTVHLPREVIEYARNVAYWTPGLTLARLVEEALLDYLEKKTAERGGTYPQRREDLSPGRPLKVKQEQE